MEVEWPTRGFDSTLSGLWFTWTITQGSAKTAWRNPGLNDCNPFRIAEAGNARCVQTDVATRQYQGARGSASQ